MSYLRRQLKYIHESAKPNGYAPLSHYPGALLHGLSNILNERWKSARGNRADYTAYKILRGVATIITPGYVEHTHHASTTTVSKGRPRPMREVARLLNITTP